MPEENEKTYIFTRQEASSFQANLTNIMVAIGEIKATLHSEPCKGLEVHKEECSRKVKDLHTRIEGRCDEAAARWDKHMDDHHSPKSMRENWVAFAVIGCTAATVASPFITWWLMSHK